ncbi:SGNH/GDSL hydrolase family protein [Vibrio pectenicida]|uniref:SGNH/GDSL hydrolase family protein n=1 Tax=Vibrio pectenicida TaxID=62763 RepID=UPI003B9D4FB9
MHKLLLSGFLLACCSFAANATTHNLDAIIIGDSLSDVGNNYWVETDGRLGSPITNWPIPEQGTGEPSTGLMWADRLGYFLSQDRGKAITFEQLENNENGNVLVAAYASAESGRGFVNDISDASAQLCTDAGLFDNYSCVPGGITQIDMVPFEQIADVASLKVFIFIGGNDLFNNLDIQVQPRQAVQAVIDHTMVMIWKLLNEKQVIEDNIYIIGLPNLALTPEVETLPQFIKDYAQELSYAYQLELRHALQRLGYDDKVKHIDILSWHRSQIDAPQWIEDPLAHTCVQDSHLEDCRTKDGDYFFFDNKHLTTQGQKAFWNNIKSVVY